MSLETLLPPSSTPLERALALLPTKFNPPQNIKTLWNADTCPEKMLPYLAWALSVDDWDATWSLERKRAAIREARFIHQHKGTLAAIKRALAVLGHQDAVVIERADCIHHNGAAIRNGWHRRRGQGGWATYRVILQRPITIDQADVIYRILDDVKRNCIHLTALDFSQAALRHNGIATRNGSYTRGIIT